MLRLLLKILITLGVPALICIAILALTTSSQRAFGEQQIEAQLTSLDQRFNAPLTPIPALVPDEILFPAQVGSFRRIELGRSLKADCGWNVGKLRLCLTAAYANGQDDPFIWLKAGQTSSRAIENRVGSMPCSSMGGELRLRTVSQNAYLYRVCLPQFEAPTSIYGISWQNGKWFIGLTGAYDLIRQLLVAYPY